MQLLKAMTHILRRCTEREKEKEREGSENSYINWESSGRTKSPESSGLAACRCTESSSFQRFDHRESPRRGSPVRDCAGIPRAFMSFSQRACGGRSAISRRPSASALPRTGRSRAMRGTPADSFPMSIALPFRGSRIFDRDRELVVRRLIICVTYKSI